MSEIHHECGVAAIYHLPRTAPSPMCPDQGPSQISRLMPRMLLDIQNRGQLAAGMTSFHPKRPEILATYKDIGTVSEVFKLSHRAKSESMMRSLAGRAAIGHVRYATCGQDDRSYAQPFERQHIHKRKWFSFCFNGQLANYQILKHRLLADGDHHLSRDTDTEIILHEVGRLLSNSEGKPDWIELLGKATKDFDGAYSMAFLTALGEMVVARDPLGIKPMCYAFDGSLFAAASEDVALVNLGFEPNDIKTLPPGHAALVTPGEGLRIEPFCESKSRAHCFFEWIYFANVASTMDEKSVYLSRTRLGEELARLEIESGEVPLDPEDTIVVPVPDTSKAAADAMAYKLGIPSREGLIRNRYSGRTFIEGGRARRVKASTKYTPLREVLEGKRVLLVEDSIVRSTTMGVLLDRIREMGGAREIHVRVASPPIVAPCFYGIDMSTIDQLIAPRYFENANLTESGQREMARELGADSLRYLPVDAIARAIGLPASDLCQACITGKYPTPCGQKLYQLELDNEGRPQSAERTYERLVSNIT
ncbi:Amidophosphoribosyltransferase [Rosistilla carotiformis]|uniref:Amidophosphoribosyltransferase n=1 Tax=Rosistilla carotiformis TaxID=2528017 RepID=A0A518K0P7_9BACT|nr:amidophosphoribosyltransferase [Rosistilla carotiformis]QDV71373.1 Amidophosphoribosyltransferase [Rosistilla carotiformis]